LDKSDRDYFAQTSMDFFQDEITFQNLMKYCAKDVLVTFRLFNVLFPKFKEKCPHPISFAGMLHMCKGYLATDTKWSDYIGNSAKLYNENQVKIEQNLLNIINDTLKLPKQHISKDPWLRNLSWEVKPIRMTKEKKTKNGLIESRPFANENMELAGKPKWYRDLWDSKEKKIKISLSRDITPYLLRLEWKGFPLLFTKKYGWLFVVPKSHSYETTETPIEEDYIHAELNTDFDSNSLYFRIPHPAGMNQNCGKPLSKNYIESFEKNILTSSNPQAKELLNLHAQGTYWSSSRDRITSQMVVWDKAGKYTGNNKSGIILPKIIPMGTVTRRATENTWLTASNSKKNSIGSELKAQIKSPPGYKIVGADVDSQELWIASMLGDSQFGFHGSTAIGFMTLQGSKANGTDLHSVTGQLIGISRDVAKIFNYSRIYGAGKKYATQLLLKHVPEITPQEAFQKSLKLFSQTKGQRYNDHKRNSFWHGGSESCMFNQLEKIARAENSKTPVLDCEIPNTLKSAVTKEKVSFNSC
jgi:DNA polymerase gamma 1